MLGLNLFLFFYCVLLLLLFNIIILILFVLLLLLFGDLNCCPESQKRSLRDMMFDLFIFISLLIYSIAAPVTEGNSPDKVTVVPIRAVLGLVRPNSSAI